MKKKLFISALVITGLAIIFYLLVSSPNKKEPITFMANGALRELSIDDKINEAQVILIGEVKTTLPSKWKFNNSKDIKRATPQEIFDAQGLFTDSIFSIDQIIKGKYDKPVIRVRTYLGETDQVQWLDPSEPSYKKEQLYLLFLTQDTGPTAGVDPGDYISVNANTAVYEIIGGRAISADDEWQLDELIAYIQNSLSAEASSPTPTPIALESLTETPLPFTDTPVSTDIPTETPLPIETESPTP